MKHRYLFDWQTFYVKKCGSKFPPLLCFPEFYALSMFAIHNWYEVTISVTEDMEFSDNVYLLCLKYFESIQTMIHLIFGQNSKIYVKSREQIHEIMSNTVIDQKSNDLSILYLEKILRDKESIDNYRAILLDTTLKYYGVDDIQQLQDRLISKKGVTTIDDDNEIKELPPPSCHYVSYHSNTTPIPLYGPRRWGPMYWIIFHALAENLDTECGEQLKTVNDFIAILPFVLPCPSCRIHYDELIKPSTIADLTDKEAIQNMYKRIHSTVTLAIKKTRG